MGCTATLKLITRQGQCYVLECTLNIVAVTRINPIPSSCSPERVSDSTHTPKSVAVTGSIIATTEATVGSV